VSSFAPDNKQSNVQGVAMMTQLMRSNKTASISFKNRMTVLCCTWLARFDDDDAAMSKTRPSASPKRMAKKITAAKLASLNDMKILDVMSFSKTPSYTCFVFCLYKILERVMSVSLGIQRGRFS
jgi:hypothetical protein